MIVINDKNKIKSRICLCFLSPFEGYEANRFFEFNLLQCIIQKVICEQNQNNLPL